MWRDVPPLPAATPDFERELEQRLRAAHRRHHHRAHAAYRSLGAMTAAAVLLLGSAAFIDVRRPVVTTLPAPPTVVIEPAPEETQQLSARSVRRSSSPNFVPGADVVTVQRFVVDPSQHGQVLTVRNANRAMGPGAAEAVGPIIIEVGMAVGDASAFAG